MASLYPLIESWLVVASHCAACLYWKPLSTDAYHTMIPSRSSFIEAWASCTRAEEEVTPLAPSRMALLGVLAEIGCPCHLLEESKFLT